MAAPVLNYADARARFPGVRAMIARCEMLLWVKIGLMLAGGALLGLILPLGLAHFLYAIAMPLAGFRPLDRLLLFATCLVCVNVLLFWLELRSRGEFLNDAIKGEGGGSDYWRTSSRGEWEVKQYTWAWILYLEYLLTGPRLMVSAVRRWQERRSIGRVDIERAAQVVWTLQAHDGGISTTALLLNGEPMSRLRPVLRFLQLHDWIDLGDKGRRVWLLSEARKTLMEKTPAGR